MFYANASPKANAPSNPILLLKRFKNLSDLLCVRFSAIDLAPLTPIWFLEISKTSKKSYYTNSFDKILAPSLPKLLLDKFKILIFGLKSNLSLFKTYTNNSASYFLKLDLLKRRLVTDFDLLMSKISDGSTSNLLYFLNVVILKDVAKLGH